MTAAPATAWTPPMTLLTGNTGGAVESLPHVTVQGAKERLQIGTIALASQIAGTVIGVARVPLGAAIVGITAITDTSLGSSTIAFGDAGSGNTAIYGAAAVLTSTNTPTTFAKAATYGVEITAGFDSVSGAANTSYEDVTLTVATATMPSSGNLTIVVRYVLD